MTHKKQTVAFATCTGGLSETQRMTQIARELKKLAVFDMLAAHYFPATEFFSFAKIVKEEGLTEVLLQPHMTKDVAEHILAVDRGEEGSEIILKAIIKKCRSSRHTRFCQIVPPQHSQARTIAPRLARTYP